MNCLIVDDQEIFRVILKKLITLDSSLQLIGECADATQALEITRNKSIDIIFLDIEMAGMNGIELAKVLEGKQPMIIFTTSQANYAIEAFDLNVVDFLVKPIAAVRFLKAVNKARGILSARKVTLNEQGEFVFIRDTNTIKRIDTKNILYLEAWGDYVKVHLQTQIYLIHSSLKSVEQKLPVDVFVKVHRSFIINLSKVDTIEGRTLIINHKMVPVSDAYKGLLNQRMHIL
jgi:two-component system LytT family response regulator